MSCELILIACIFLCGVLIRLWHMMCVKQYHTCNTVNSHTTSTEVIVNLAPVHFSLQVQGKILLQKVREFILYSLLF